MTDQPHTASVLDSMTGKQMPGGCHDCAAFQTVDLEDGIYILRVHHDDTCPALAEMERREQ